MVLSKVESFGGHGFDSRLTLWSVSIHSHGSIKTSCAGAWVRISASLSAMDGIDLVPT